MARALFRTWPARAALAVFALGAISLVPPIGNRLGPGLHAISAVASILAAVSIHIASAGTGGWWSPIRRSWTLVSVGLGLGAIVDTLFALQLQLLGGYEFPTAADYLWFASSSLILVGVLLIPHARYSGRARIKLILDLAAGIIALAVLAWVFYLSDLLKADVVTDSPAGEILVGAFTIQDLLALLIVLLLSTRRGPTKADATILTVSAGLLSGLAGNFATGVVAGESGTTATSYLWLNGFYVLVGGFFLLTGAFLLHRGLPRATVAERISPRVVAGPYALVAALVTADLFEPLIGTSTAELLHIPVIVIGALLFVRQSVSIAEVRAYLERQRDEMVASVSHELRTPLTAVTGFSSMLSGQWEELDEESRREFATLLDEHAQRVSRMVFDLVELSREDLTQIRLRRSDQRVVVLIHRALEGLIGSGVDVSTSEIDVPLDLRINVDRDRMTQVLSNLVANAAKFGKGQIKVTGRLGNESVTISVADNGPGIPEKYVGAIFDRFERGAYRLNANVPGTGIGLPIAQALVHAHGGTITVGQSAQLGGAEFVVTLPLTTAAHLPVG